MEKENLGILKQIITLIIIFIICLSMNSRVLAAQDWSAVWGRLEGQDLAVGSQIWNESGNASAMIDARDISESELLALDSSDRRAYILFCAAFISYNTSQLGADSNSTATDICRGMRRSIEILESKSTDLTSEETTKINEFNTMASNLVSEENGEARFDNYEDFLENATEAQIQEARELGGFRNQNGDIEYFTPEQLEELNDVEEELIDETNEAANNNKSEHTILDRKPIGLLANEVSDGQITVDDTIDGAMDFVNRGDDIIVQDRLQETIGSLYNVLLVIAMVVAVVTGLIIAIKFMTSSVEGKAEVKKTLVPYVISCAVTFGAFGIWKLVVEILNNLE